MSGNRVFFYAFSRIKIECSPITRKYGRDKTPYSETLYVVKIVKKKVGECKDSKLENELLKILHSTSFRLVKM